MYPKEFEKSIKKVEATREERMKGLPERMNAKQRESILQKWHPDYKPEAKRALKIGPSRGNVVPSEVADLIEAGRRCWNGSSTPCLLQRHKER